MRKYDSQCVETVERNGQSSEENQEGCTIEAEFEIQ